MSRSKCDRDKAFAQTMRSGPTEFAQRLKAICKSCGDKGLAQNHIVFLDKNHPKDVIGKVISDISSNCPVGLTPKFLYMIPEIMPKTALQDYPFSATFLLQSFARGLKRTAHETLDNSDPIKLVEIQTMFIQLQKNV